MAVYFVMLALVLLSGCASAGSVQDNPSAHQKFVFASAYSTESCQDKMNDLAGSTVEMIEDDQHDVISILSLGIVPSHRCTGVARESAIAAPESAKRA